MPLLLSSLKGKEKGREILASVSRFSEMEERSTSEHGAFPLFFYPLTASLGGIGALVNLTATYHLLHHFNCKALCYYLLLLDCIVCGVGNFLNAITCVILILTNNEIVCLFLQFIPVPCGSLSFALTITISAHRCQGFRLKPKGLESEVRSQRIFINCGVFCLLSGFAAYFAVLFLLIGYPAGLSVQICMGNGFPERTLSSVLPLGVVFIMAVITTVLDLANLKRMM